MHNKIKSFWQRPEGKTGMLVTAGLVGAGGYGLYKVLPALIKLAENTLYLVGLLGALAAVVYVALDPRFRNLIWFGYKALMRGLTSLFIRIDPIAILESYIELLRKNLHNMDAQIGLLRGQMHHLRTQIEENDREIEKSLLKATKAEREHLTEHSIVEKRKAGRLQEFNETLGRMYGKLDTLYRVLDKMHSVCGVMTEDLSHQVKMKKQERKIIRASHSAMKSALAIIRGNDDKRLIFDQTMEAITEDVSLKMGELERFIETSGSVIRSIDLQNGIYEERGMQMLEEWTRTSMPSIFGQIPPSSHLPTAPRPSSGGFGNLFKI